MTNNLKKLIEISNTLGKDAADDYFQSLSEHEREEVIGGLIVMVESVADAAQDAFTKLTTLIKDLDNRVRIMVETDNDID